MIVVFNQRTSEFRVARFQLVPRVRHWYRLDSSVVQAKESLEEVLLCRVCGHENPPGNTVRCNNCSSSLSGVSLVAQAKSLVSALRRRLRLPRNRYFIAMAVALVLVAWWLVDAFDVPTILFPPPGATSALSADTGPQTWAQARRTPDNAGFTPDSAPFPERVKWVYGSSGPLLSSPAVAGRYVYLTTEDGHTLALDRETGEPVWQYASGFPSSSTPAVTDDLVVFAVRRGIIVALDRETGEVVWETDIASPVFASPVVAEGTVYIGAGDKKLYALDVATGERRWDFATKDWILASASYSDGVVVVASKDSRVHTVSARTGRRGLYYDAGQGRRIGGGPVTQGDLAIFGSKGGLVYAIDRKAKTYPLGRAIFRAKINLYVWNAISNPVQKGTVWSATVTGDVTHTPAVADGTVFVAATPGRVFALDSSTGEQRWEADLGVNITSAPIVAGDTLLVGTEDGAVLGVDIESGAVLWDFKTGDQITASPIVAGDTMFVSSHDGKLYAVGAAE